MPKKTGDDAAAAGVGAVPGRQPRANRAAAPADPPEVKAAAVSPRARKAAAEKQKAGTKQPAGRGKKGVKEPFVHRPRGPDLRADLRSFVTARPAGWGHEDWVAFLDHLRERGHDTGDPDAIGLALERERLRAVLERVQGMGPRRVDAVVARYDTIWSARQADVDEIASLPGMNRALAEKVRQALHG